MVVCPRACENLQLGIAAVKGCEMLADLLLGHCIRKVILTLEDELGRHIGIEVIQ